MKKWPVLALALVTLVGLGALVWQLRSSEAPAAVTGPTAGDPVAGGAGTTRGTSPQPAVRGSVTPGAPGEPGDEPPTPLTPEERASVDMEHVLAGDVPQAVMAAASGCFNGSGLSYKELEEGGGGLDIDFKVVLKDGTVTLQDVKLAKGIGDADLEQCVVEVVGEVSWDDPVNPDFSVDTSQHLSLLALKKWGEPMPHELEEIPETPEEADFGPKVRGGGR